MSDARGRSKCAGILFCVDWLSCDCLVYVYQSEGQGGEPIMYYILRHSITCLHCIFAVLIFCKEGESGGGGGGYHLGQKVDSDL